MRHIAGIVLWLCLLASAAGALMAPEYYRQARAEAPYHVQVAIDKVTWPDSEVGSCLVAGTVVETFKDDGGRLAVGTPVSFGVACYRDNAEVPVGGVIWTRIAALETARFIEVYLVEDGQGFDVALWNSRIVATPTKDPQFPID
ncbi:MAG TPA: hypothetical protein VNR88_14720 [Hyphomicrobium sp.]|nr:hypothetical protein [Hyphomicrobium sp.]